MYCEVCSYKQDDVDRIPRFLTCSHTFCNRCLEKLFEQGYNMQDDQSFVSIETNNDNKFNCPTCRAEYKEHPNSFPVNRLALEVSENPGDLQPMFYCRTCVKYILPDDVLDHRHHDIVKALDANSTAKATIKANTHTHSKDSLSQMNLGGMTPKMIEYNTLKETLKEKSEFLKQSNATLISKQNSGLKQLEESMDKIINHIKRYAYGLKEEFSRCQNAYCNELENQAKFIDDKFDELTKLSSDSIKNVDLVTIVNVEEINNQVNKFNNLGAVLPELQAESNFDLFENFISIRQAGSESNSASVTKSGSQFRKQDTNSNQQTKSSLQMKTNVHSDFFEPPSSGNHLLNSTKLNQECAPEEDLECTKIQKQNDTNLQDKCSPIQREEEVESKIAKNTNRKQSKKVVPAKGEPHFRMQELVTKLKGIKDEPALLKQASLQAYPTKERDQESGQEAEEADKGCSWRNPGNISTRDHLDTEHHEKLKSGPTGDQKQKQVRNKVMKDINLTKLQKASQKVGHTSGFRCMQCTEVIQKQHTRLKCGHFICRGCKHSNGDIIQNKMIECCNIVTKFEIKK